METESETESAVTMPNLVGLYGSAVTHACTNQVGSYCYDASYGPPVASTASAVRPYLDNAARNWGCDWNFIQNVPNEQPSGAWAKWYGTQADNSYGCGVAWWNPKKQVAYFLPNSDRSGNVALASRGATVSVSSTYSSGTPASAIIDGNRRGNPWDHGGGWSSKHAPGYPTASAPEWIEIRFPTSKTLNEIVVSTLQDALWTPVEPSINQTFSKYGIRDFGVFYWNGSGWHPLQFITANTQVYRRVTFNPITTTKIKINITAALDGAARVTEVEAYETHRVSKTIYDKYQARNLDTGVLGLPISNPIPYGWANTTSQIFEHGRITHRLGNAVADAVLDGAATDLNVALAHNGGVASSSGAYPTQPVWTINDGRRSSPYEPTISQYAYWGSTDAGTKCNVGNWWTRVDFAKPREISEIHLSSLQDNYWVGAEPTTSTVTSSYGNVDFHLQYCPNGATCAADGTGWVEPAGGHITGNTKAQNSITFAPVQATAVRAVLDCSQSTMAHVVELEAWQRAPEPSADAVASIPTWTTTSLFSARYYHSSTLLSSGKVLVAGGLKTSNASWDSAELYDPSTGTWSSGGLLATPRGYHTATLLPSGKVLVTGGSGSGHNSPAQAAAELYDPISSTWSATNSLATARRWHTATLLPSGKVLVVGGVTQYWDFLSSAELYDPSTGTWSPAGSLKGPRANHTATLLASGKVLVAAGWGPHGDSLGTDLPTAELYDPDTNSWSSTGNLAIARRVPTATLLPSGKVLVAGGQTTGRSADSTELYDPTTGTWSAAAWLNTARSYHTATLLPSGKVLVTGGFGPYGAEIGTSMPSTELYDPGTNTWSYTVSLPSPRNSHTATLFASGSVIVVGGIGPGGITVASAAVFGTPPTTTGVESEIEGGYLNPQLHTVTKSPVVFSRGTDQVIVWERKFDGVAMLTDARSAQLASGNWKTRFLREVSGPEPVRHADVWTFAAAAQAVGLDPNAVSARLVFRPELEQSNKVANPTNAADVEMVVKSYQLAIELVDDVGMTVSYVDAYTGQLIEQVSQRLHTAAPTMKYGVVNLDVAVSGGVAVMRDPIRGSLLNASLVPINGQGLVSGGKPTNMLAEHNYLVLPTTPDYRNDIAYGVQQSWDYFLEKFGRRGLRNLPRSTTGLANDAIVFFKNAPSPNLGMYNRSGVIEVLQDPNGRWQGFVTADVVGHEWTHAVWAADTGHRQVAYDWGSNGGLNEANSDLFGQLIEARARAQAGLQPNPNTIDDGWVYGQDSGANLPSTKRFMCTPSQSPGTYYDFWFAGFENPYLKMEVHAAAGPLIRVFCLLGRGMLPDVAPNDPVLRSPIAPKGFAALGAEKVGRLQYQSLTYLRGYPTPVTYFNQREAMLSAATALYGEYSDEYKAVQDAFAVVNVGPPADRVAPIITLTSGTLVGTAQPISVGVAAANPIRSVTFTLNGTPLGMLTTPPWQVIAPKKPPGPYTLQVTAVDSHKNTATSTWIVTFQDTTVPELCEIAVGPSGGPTGELNVIVSGRDDVSGLSGLDIHQQGVGFVKSDYTAVAPGVTKGLVFTKTFAPGTYTFQGWCGDKANNIAKSVMRSYTVGSPTPPCNTTAIAGGNSIDQRTFEMGKTSGTVKLTFQTFGVHDRIKVLYQGAVVADTMCQATGDGAPAWAQSFQFSGTSSQLTVRVEPNCNPATAAPTTQWNYKLSCP